MGTRLFTRNFTLACLGLLLIAPVVSAQSIENGAIIGSVVDGSGEALPGVTVRLSSDALGTSLTDLLLGFLTIDLAEANFLSLTTPPGILYLYRFSVPLVHFRSVSSPPQVQVLLFRAP